jgi:hypothetical protein
MKIDNRSLEYIETRKEEDSRTEGFDGLVPGLADISERRGRRLRASQIDPDDDDAVETMMEMAEDESVTWEEE